MSTSDGPSTDDLPFLSVAYGGGGSFGTGYNLGAAHALIEAGVPLRGAPSIGTSAGAWAAACVATGTEFARVAELPPLRLPDLRPGLLRGYGQQIFDNLRAPEVSVSAIALHDLQHRMLSGEDHPLADLVAASSAIPGLLSPVGFGGHVYIDGGIRSVVSADLAAPARHLLVIAPMAGAPMGLVGMISEYALTIETTRWERLTGGTVHLIRPNSAVASLIRSPSHYFEHEVLQRAYPLAREQVKHLVVSRSDLRELVADHETPLAA